VLWWDLESSGSLWDVPEGSGWLSWVLIDSGATGALVIKLWCALVVLVGFGFVRSNGFWSCGFWWALDGSGLFWFVLTHRC
jgi:hypothetical protein